MSNPDTDLLRKAAAAMRAERTGHNPGSGFTRARILNDVRAGRKKRRRWWRIGFPVGILLAGTTAWASASGKWPEVLHNISTLLNLPLTDNGESERSLATAKSTNAMRSRDVALGAPSHGAPSHGAPVPSDGAPVPSQDIAPTEPETEAPTEAEAAPRVPSPTPEPLAPAMKNAAEPAAKTPRSRARKDVRSTRSNDWTETSDTSARPSPAPPPPELEAEIRSFRRADDLYRRNGDLEGAIRAYRQYVRDYPTGRFVPEAKYNTALSLLKLGRASEARPLLVPFAEGAYGQYRREAAQKLLHALR